MFFELSKILWWLISPANVIFLCVLVGTVCLWAKWQRTGRYIISTSLLIYVFFGCLPVGSFLLAKLENRFPAQKILPEKIDGIIVLGGVLDVYLSKVRGTPVLNGNAERITSLVDLTQTYSNVPVLFTGGAGLIGYPKLKESKMLEDLLVGLIQGEGRLLLESESRNTYENALFSKKIIEEQGGGIWLLVTSASHMPRAVGAFRKQEIDVIPYPVDFKGAGNLIGDFSFTPSPGLGVFSTALHEWLGLFAYYVTGKSSQFYPAP